MKNKILLLLVLLIPNVMPLVELFSQRYYYDERMQQADDDLYYHRENTSSNYFIDLFKLIVGGVICYTVIHSIATAGRKNDFKITKKPHS